MFTISKTFEFSASHRLDHLPSTHPCWRHHGHNYRATFVLEARRLDEDGMVEDYRSLDDVKAMIDARLDHQDLNGVLYPMRTTAEEIARYLYDWAKPLHRLLAAVVVSETERTSAEYRPS